MNTGRPAGERVLIKHIRGTYARDWKRRKGFNRGNDPEPAEKNFLKGALGSDHTDRGIYLPTLLTEPSICPVERLRTWLFRGKTGRSPMSNSSFISSAPSSLASIDLKKNISAVGETAPIKNKRVKKRSFYSFFSCMLLKSQPTTCYGVPSVGG